MRLEIKVVQIYPVLRDKYIPTDGAVSLMRTGLRNSRASRS